MKMLPARIRLGTVGIRPIGGSTWRVHRGTWNDLASRLDHLRPREVTQGATPMPSRSHHRI